MIRSALLFALALALSASSAVAQSGDKLYYPECAPFADSYTFDCYHDFAEVESFVTQAVEAHPDRARLESIGTSFQGRDLWVLTITDFQTGDPADKSAMWVDGGVDSDEVIATEAALGLIHRLLTSDDPQVTNLLATRTFYVAPNVIPDGSELHHHTPERPRDSTLRPWDDDGDGLLDEDGVEDLDGDGQALQMRVLDPTGTMVVMEEDARLMRQRRLGDTGPFYRVYLEGIDNDGDGSYQEDRPGGIDPNRNYPGNWSANQNGSGPFPGSESELRASLDFVLAHPNIAASQHYHSSGGVILRPPSVPDWSLPGPDEQLYVALARRGLEVTGYSLSTSVYDWNWPRGSSNKKPGQVWRNDEGEVESGPIAEDAYPAYGGSIDGLYSLFGILAFANEIYQLGEDEDGDGRISDLERMAANDAEMDGAAFANWTAFDHPQLGPVEIGGWKKFGQNNPIDDRIHDEVTRNVDFALLQAENMPLLSVTEVVTEDLGDGVTRITATVSNLGAQPTELAVRVESGKAVPVRASLVLSGAVELLSEDQEVDLGTIGGHQAAESTWLVRGSGTVSVEAWHPKGGRTSDRVELGG